VKAFTSFISKHATALLVAVILLTVGLLAFFASPNEDGTRTFDGKAPVYTDAQNQALCETKAKIDNEVKALSGIDVPQDASSGCEPTDLPQMGALAYYDVDVSTPDAFYNAVNGKGFNEGYGYQCVAGFKEFMYALSGKYVATSNGGASGYAKQQSQIEPLGFTWHNGSSGLQNGDWAIWTTGQYGHVSMYYNGKWFGQNQYAADPNVGNPFNLASISTSGIAGYYRPNIYQNQTPPDTGGGDQSNSGGSDASNVAATHTVQQGDTLGGVALGERWWPSTTGLYGNEGYAQRLAEYNGIEWRGLIYPNQVVKRLE
jgi:hypothetical protein